MTYAAPLDEMRFVLNRLAGLPEIATFPGYEEAEPELIEAILTEAARFATEVLAPLNATGDRQGCRWAAGKVATPDGFPEAYRQFIEAGWHAMPAGTDIGGQGMPALVSSAVAEMWKSSNLAFSLCQMLTMGAVEALDASRVRRTASGAICRKHGRRRMDRDDEPDRAAGRLRPRRARARGPSRTATAATASSARRSSSPGANTTSPRTSCISCWRGCPTRRAGTRGISLFLVPKFLVDPDGSPGAQRRRLRLHRAQARHPRLAHLRDVLRRRRRARSAGWSASRTAGLRTMFTMMNNARLNVGAQGVGYRRARLPAGASTMRRSACRGSRSGGRRRRADHRTIRTCAACS